MMVFLFFAAIALVLFGQWYSQRVPAEDVLFAQAKDMLRANGAVSDTVDCFMLTPVRAEEQQSADAWLACQHDKSQPGQAFVLWWNDSIEGTRGLHWSKRELDIEESNRWTR